MRPLFAAVTLLAVVFIAAGAERAQAVPACFPTEETLVLTPTTARYNWAPVTRSSTTGRYETDAGFEFDHESARATALPEPFSAECGAPTKSITLVYVDPWTGESRTMSLAATDLAVSP